MLGLGAKPMLVAMATALVLSSCVTEDDMMVRDESNQYQGEPIVLGKQLENPYTIPNMQRAYEVVKQKHPQTVSINIRPTHWYVRFIPSDLQEYDRLKSDSTIEVFDHPLDFEIVKNGDYYHDPAIDKSKPTYQYAAVPVDFVNTSRVPFQVLSDLFLPGEVAEEVRKNSGGRSQAEVDETLNMLEDESLMLTGNFVENTTQNQPASARSNAKWHPAGRVTVWDNRLNEFIPLEGVKVQARRWFTVHQGITDESGYYHMNSFRRPANYRIVWERAKFDIRSGTFGQAVLDGPKMKGDWNVEIRRGGMQFHYAHVFRAAHRYYYGNIGGLRRPGFRIKYSVFNKKGDHMARNLGNWSVFGINPNILIYRFNPNDRTENDSDEMFSATCHETAHSTHIETMNAGLIQFGQVSETIRESWAIGVEWYITQMEYKELGITNYGEPTFRQPVTYPALYGFQYWSRSRSENLTSLFIDLVDTHNQRGQSFGTYRRGVVKDQVYGYTLAGIESGFLKEVYGVGSLSEKLKVTKPAEITDQDIDLLLDYF